MAALPALSKNWCTRANIPFPSNTTAENIADSAWWLLKACLMDQVSTGTLVGTRHANSVWGCVRSSDGSAYGATDDGVDRWLSSFDATKLVHANTGSAHSWAILRNSTLGRDLLLGLNSTTPANGRIACTKSSVPFTGGTASAEPATTSESFQLATSSDSTSTSVALVGDSTIGGTFYAHFSCDDSGQFVFLINRASVGKFNGGVILFQTVNAHASDTRNVFLFGGGQAASATRGWPDASIVRGSTGCVAFPTIGTSASNTSGVAIPYMHSASLLEQNAITDALSAQVRFVELECWDNTTTAPVYRGEVPDIYGVIGGGVGTSYPTTAAQEYVQAGNFLVPFVGTSPSL